VSLYNSVISTDATDSATPIWDATITNTQGQFVQVSALKRVYRCASASSLNEYPPANPTIWTDYGAVNSYKMFDDIIGSQTVFTNTCTISLDFNLSNTLSILNMKNVNSITITDTDLATGDIFYSNTINMIDYGALSLYDYWYKPTRYRTDFFLHTLEFVPKGRLDITFTSNSGDGAVGAVITGLSDKLGVTLYGTSVKLDDYSKYVFDEFGNTSFSRRGYAKTITAQALIDTNLTDETITKLADLRGETNLFIVDEREDGFGSLTTLGYIKDLTIKIDNPTKLKFPIKIIGVG